MKNTSTIHQPTRQLLLQPNFSTQGPAIQTLESLPSCRQSSIACISALLGCTVTCS